MEEEKGIDGLFAGLFDIVEDEKSKKQ